MANSTTNPRFWKLDTAAVINAVGTPTLVRKLVFCPNAASDAIVIQEYLASGSLADSIDFRAGASDASPVMLDWGPECRKLNGFKLATIGGGTLYVWIGEN